MKNKYCQYKPLTGGVALYRYITLERLSQLLFEKSVRFNRADQLIEYHKTLITPAERRYLQGIYLNEDGNENRKAFNRSIAEYKRLERQIYLSCWTNINSNELWKRYFPEGDGLLIKTSSDRFIKCITESDTLMNFHFMEVEYVDIEQPIDQMPDGISIFGRKSLDYAIENEVRCLFQIASKKTNPEFYNIKVNLSELIEEIIISPHASFDFRIKLNAMLDNEIIRKDKPEIWKGSHYKHENVSPLRMSTEPYKKTAYQFSRI